MAGPPLLPPSAARLRGWSTAPRDEQAAFTAAVYGLTSDCAWRRLSPTFGTSPTTAHRRCTRWTAAGLGRRPPDGCRKNPGPGVRLI
ncbi:transposase [Streptomyces sp900105245]|uniref:Transposase n=1 Tax=Streptomyces sp. 900105245 TaxID=3154379 RepID=A0ABV1U3M9_9ACTN